MINIDELKADDIDPRRDLQWNEFVVLRIGPHPGLSDGARRAIELDYGMQNGEIAIKTPVCLSFYLERRLNLDIDLSILRPERVQLILLNRAEVEEKRNRTVGKPEE
jgi:hypothetical protein